MIKQASITVVIGLALLQPVMAMHNSAINNNCDRQCLYGFVDRYMDALVDQDPSRLPWADHVIFTENSVQLKVGDGLWGTISGKRDYDLNFADPEHGQAGYFGVVEEHGIAAVYTMRIKIRHNKIKEVETVLSRPHADSPFPAPDNLVEPDPIMLSTVPAEQRRPRARMLSLADGYFDTLQLNDGTLVRTTPAPASLTTTRSGSAGPVRRRCRPARIRG